MTTEDKPLAIASTEGLGPLPEPRYAGGCSFIADDDIRAYALAEIDRALTRRDVPRWWKCDTHGPAKAGAWGCPECVREMRVEIERLRGVIAKAEHWAEHAMLMRSAQNVELLGILRPNVRGNAHRTAAQEMTDGPK